MTEKKAGKQSEEQSFEKSLERLETIVDEMERGELSLEKMMSHFEEGQKLIGTCTKKLNEVERKIEILVQKDGRVTTEPFEEEESGESGGETRGDPDELF